MTAIKARIAVAAIAVAAFTGAAAPAVTSMVSWGTPPAAHHATAATWVKPPAPANTWG